MHDGNNQLRVRGMAVAKPAVDEFVPRLQVMSAFRQTGH
jgi:hypothetical protein